MKTNYLTTCCAVLVALLSSCKDSPDVPENTETIDTEYSVWLTTNSGSSYIVTTDDLMKQQLLTPAGNKGVDITSYLPASYYAVYSYIYGGRFYLSNTGQRFSQHQLTADGAFKETNNYAFPGTFYIGKVAENVSSANEFVFSGTGGVDKRPEGRKVYEKSIYFMNTANMTMNKTLKAELPYLDYTVYKGDGTVDPTTINVTSMYLGKDKAYFGYFYYTHDYKSVNDTAYVYVCDYPSMANGKVTKSKVGGQTDGHWSVEKRSFVDAQDNVYFITQKPNGDKGLIRIKNGEREIDKDYFFDLAGFPFGDGTIVELGNGKTYISPYVIDAAEKKISADLRILTSGQAKTSLNFMENGNLYEVFKTDESRWFVYEYNPVTNSVRRGAEIDPGVSDVWHISKLK